MTHINPLELVGQIPMQSALDSMQPLDNVSLWLQECGLSEYSQIFKESGYDDINLIKILNESDLDAMGIEKPGTRKKILMYADQLKQITDTQLIDQRVRPPRPKGNSRANPYRCTKCCEFKIRSLDGKAHQCKPELIGHSWDQCPTQNIRQHPEERQRRKQEQKLKKNRTRKRKSLKDDHSPILDHSIPSPETVTAWEYTTDHYHQDGPTFTTTEYSDEHGQPIFGFEGPPHKRIKIDISQQVADVSAAVMENYLSDEIAKQLSSGATELDPHTIALPTDELNF